MSSEAPPEGAAKQDEPAVAKAGPKGVVLIGALVGGLVLGAVGGLLALGPMMAKKAGYTTTATPDSAAAEGGGGEHDGKEGEAAPATVHLIDNVILNPAGSGATRFLMMQAAVDVKDAAAVEALKARDAEIRDVVLRVMGRKTVEQLSELSNRDGFKAELLDSLGALVPKGTIRRVYFPQFVIQ